MTPRRRWLFVLACGAIMITLTMGLHQTFGLFLSPISESLGIGREMFAFAIAIQNLIWGASSPFFGALADRYGARWIAAAGGVIYTAGLVLMGMASSGGEVMAGQFLIGLGMGGTGFSVVLGIVAKTVSPEKCALALGFVSAGGSSGQFAMVPIGQGLLAAFDWQIALFVLAAIAATMIGFAFGLSEKPDSDSKAMRQTIAEALREALAYRRFVLLTVGFFVCGFQVVFIATHLPAFYADNGVGGDVAAWALSLVGLFNIVGSLGFGWAGGRWSKRNALVILYSLRSLVILVFMLLPVTPASALIFGATIGCLWLATVPLISGLIATFFGTRNPAMLYGIVFVSHQVGSFLGAWLGGYIYDRTGSYSLMWWLVVASGAVAAILHIMIREALANRPAAVAA
ncbi:MAG: MFS transporter [Rhodospirillaceae bacterium]|nr:MFS transporter [Rhodospirillaceae bacterium]